MTRLIFADGDMAFVVNGVITGYTGSNGKANDLTRIRLRCKLINQPKEGFRIMLNHPELPSAFTITHEQPIERIEHLREGHGIPRRVADGKGAHEPAGGRAPSALKPGPAFPAGHQQHHHP